MPNIDLAVAVIGAIGTIFAAWITAHFSHNPPKKSPAKPRDLFSRVLSIIAIGVGSTALVIGLLQPGDLQGVQETPPAPRAPITWTSLSAKLPLGTLPVESDRTVTIEIPQSVPSTAREILLYATLHSGDINRRLKADFHIFTQNGNEKYGKLLYWFQFPNKAYVFNSENLWLPLTPERKLHIQLIGDPIQKGAAGEISLLGYRE